MSESGLPPHVLTEIDSSIRGVRLAGVEELARLASGADLAVAAAARQALRRLSGDDSRSVAAAAAAAIERTAVRLNPDRVDFGRVSPETPPLVADVLVEGPPLAVEAATVNASGPGLRALLNGRRLRIQWSPESDWLDGSVTVRGPAGWSEVRVTGEVASGAQVSRAAVEARLLATDGSVGGARMTVLPRAPASPARPRTGAALLIAGLAVLVLLGGVGVTVALTGDETGGRPVSLPTVAASAPAPSAPAPSGAAPSGAAPSGAAGPGPATVSPVPLARRVASTGKPVVVGTIRVGVEPEGVMVSPDGRTVYVANQNSRRLSVVDAVSRRVTSVALRNKPRFVCVSGDSRLVFVSMYEDDLSGSGVAVVDAASRKVARHLTTGKQPFTLAVAPDGSLWVPIHSSGRVEIFGAGDHRAVGRVTVPPNPHAVGFSAGLKRAFIASHESDAVAVVDMRGNRVLTSIPVSRAPHSVAVSPDGHTALVAGYQANTADLIDAVTLKRTGPFRVGRQPQSVAFSTDGRHGYVVNEGDDTITVLDGRTGRRTATLRVGRSPRAIAVSPDGRLAFVTNGGDNTVSVLRVGG